MTVSTLYCSLWVFTSVSAGRADGDSKTDHFIIPFDCNAFKGGLVDNVGAQEEKKNTPSLYFAHFLVIDVADNR